MKKPWHKYNAKPITVDGIYYPSTMEYNFSVDFAKRFGYALQPHPPVVVLAQKGKTKISWKLDYFDPTTGYYYDVKGKETAVFKEKVKFWKLFGKAPLIKVTQAPGLPFPWIMTKIDPEPDI